MSSGIQFPDELGPPNRDGYEDGYEESRSDTPMDIGPPRRRNLFTVTPRTFNVSWKWTFDQYELFEIWWEESIGQGVLEFDVQLLDDTEELQWFTCTFQDGKFTASATDGQTWNVSGVLRSIAPSFPVRVPMTDQLHGRARFSFKAQGYLPKVVVLRGKASFGLTVRKAALEMPPISGKCALGIKTAKGELE